MIHTVLGDIAADKHSRYIDLLKITLEAGIEKLLLSQDAGVYNYGGKSGENTIFPYTRIFKEFIPLCLERGIPREKIDRLLVGNPKKVLDI